MRSLELLAELSVTLSGVALLVGKAKLFPRLTLSAPTQFGDVAWATLSLGLPGIALVALFVAHRRAGDPGRAWRTILGVLGSAELLAALALRGRWRRPALALPRYPGRPEDSWALVDPPASEATGLPEPSSGRVGPLAALLGLGIVVLIRWVFFSD